MAPLGETASRVLAAIQSTGGITRTELCVQLNLGWGTVGHHIWRLEGDRQIRSQRVGRFLWLFPASIQAHEGRMIAGLRRPEARCILEHVIRRKESTISALSEQTNMNRRMVSSQLRTLEVAGLIEKRDSNPNLYSAAEPDANRILNRFSGKRDRSLMESLSTQQPASFGKV